MVKQFLTPPGSRAQHARSIVGRQHHACPGLLAKHGQKRGQHGAPDRDRRLDVAEKRRALDRENIER